MVFQSVKLINVNKKSINEKSVGLHIYSFTKVLTMPGGDDIPSEPPWPIPERPIITDPSQLDDLTDAFYFTTKFSMSPGQGNLMFQYASIFAMSQRYNATLIIPEGMLLRRAFHLPGAKIVNLRTYMYLLKNWKRKTFPQCCRYYNETENLKNATRFALYGYFQSYKYFQRLRTKIENEFRFLPSIRHLAWIELKKALKKALKKDTSNHSIVSPTLVGIHVRRGLDMTWNSRNQHHGHTVATKSYFLEAMRYFRMKFPDVLFVVCTDDLYWTKENLGNLQNTYVVNNKHREIAMCVLSMCNHTIISQGTFSWWAAWLAGGETIYYNGWPRRGSELDSMLNKDDFFLPKWIPMQ